MRSCPTQHCVGVVQTVLMTTKTNFSFELFYTDRAAVTTEQRAEVMRELEPSLNTAFKTKDDTAVVTVYDSHKGAYNKIVELVTTQTDEQINQTLKEFCNHTGLTATALE